VSANVSSKSSIKNCLRTGFSSQETRIEKALIWSDIKMMFKATNLKNVASI